MRVDHSRPMKPTRRPAPSFWADPPTDDAFSLLESALQGDEASQRRDEPADEPRALLEENARLRELLAQLSDIVRRNAQAG